MLVTISLNNSQCWLKEGCSSVEEEESLFIICFLAQRKGHNLSLVQHWAVLHLQSGNQLIHIWRPIIYVCVYTYTVCTLFYIYTILYMLFFICTYICICMYMPEGDGEAQWLVDCLYLHITNILLLW